VSGGPASEAPGNVSIKAYVSGTDLTGAQPVQSTAYTSVSNGTGPFTINITAPNKEQVITLIVEVNSTVGGRFEKTTVTRAVTVITPIILTATFRNDGGAAAVDVPVKFFVDGKVAGATNISRIDPGQTGTAKLSYLPVGLAAGGHTVRVEADLNRNGVIEPDKGEVAVVDVFYKKDFELTWPYAALIMGVTVSVSYLVIRARRRRR
jgi:subtilase family serine protease